MCKFQMFILYCYKNIFKETDHIYPYVISTGYKNIPVERTFSSTPNDVIITSSICITFMNFSGL